jgi:seryl-tRNA synthetase
LARGWAFTMREGVCVGSEDDVSLFRERGLRRAEALAAELGLEARVTVASDPFFAPTARGRAVIQRLKSLKHELLLSIGDGAEIAAASFNLHEQFFGEAFGIRTREAGRGKQREGSSRSAAWSSCVALGLERWLLAFLVAHGPDRHRWPELRVPRVSVGNAHDRRSQAVGHR